MIIYNAARVQRKPRDSGLTKKFRQSFRLLFSEDCRAVLESRPNPSVDRNALFRACIPYR